MTFALPAVHNTHRVNPTTNAEFNHTIGAPASAGAKAAGNLPIVNNAGDWEVTNTDPSEGYGYTFVTAQDVGTDTVLMLWHSQNNAPNRINVDTVANGGVELRLYSGTGAPPTVFRGFYISGNDTKMSKNITGQYPIIIDLNSDSHDTSSGTFDNTNVTVYELTKDHLNITGTSTCWSYEGEMYLVATTKTSSSTPTFTGASNFVEAVTLIQGTSFSNKLGNWVRQIGSVVFMDMAFRIGDNSTSTQFDQQGVTIVSPVSNDATDPTKRLTLQAMRVYLNLRNNAADTALLDGAWVWGTRAVFDFDQDDSAVVTFTNPSFTGMGEITLGSSITGPASFDDADKVIFADNGVDLDGSTFKNPFGNHLLELAA